MGSEMCIRDRDMAQAFDEGAVAGVRVALLQGAGDRAFCTGYDLAELHSMSGGEAPEDWASSFPELTGMLRAIEAFQAPVIGVLGGHAIGGGALLASFCDLRIAREGVRFQIPASRLGVLYPLEGIRRLVAVVGQARASSMLLRARSVSTDEGLAAGLYESVESAEDLPRAAEELAREIASRAPLAIAGLKTLLRGIAMDQPNDEARSLLHLWTSRCLSSSDLAEGLSAALARREPEFTGS